LRVRQAGKWWRRSSIFAVPGRRQKSQQWPPANAAMPVRIARRDCPPSRPQSNCWTARRLMKLPACRSGCVGPVWLW
jgi:hypothetical protein